MWHSRNRLVDFASRHLCKHANVVLAFQVSSLRSTTVEFEGAKHEIRHLQEEVEVLNSQVEELGNLKKIAEKQLEEALESLQAEREQRYALKKELDNKNNSESMFQLGNLALSIQVCEKISRFLIQGGRPAVASAVSRNP